MYHFGTWSDPRVAGEAFLFCQYDHFVDPLLLISHVNLQDMDITSSTIVEIVEVYTHRGQASRHSTVVEIHAHRYKWNKVQYISMWVCDTMYVNQSPMAQRRMAKQDGLSSWKAVNSEAHHELLSDVSLLVNTWTWKIQGGVIPVSQDEYMIDQYKCTGVIGREILDIPATMFYYSIQAHVPTRK
ncbi:hypothetical protein IW261DRAFT_1420279 [Armillaria novae-zelandiae]|uniref:Uncharacterized protein n=1 Tax=Armillaria novae-zelandiae TaxID=153914 RepID=A0AA39UHD7_9AGAR|nr:hypothetical protein IW261DRAFT_1420279 [Armillaria novae-zelandiae]